MLNNFPGVISPAYTLSPSGPFLGKGAHPVYRTFEGSAYAEVTDEQL